MSMEIFMFERYMFLYYEHITNKRNFCLQANCNAEECGFLQVTQVAHEPPAPHCAFITRNSAKYICNMLFII